MLGGLFDRRARRFCGGEPWGAGAGREFPVDAAWYVFILCSFNGNLVFYPGHLRKSGSWQKAGEDRVVKQRPEVYRQYGYNAFCIEDALLLYLADIIFVLYR